ncbi:hypothetical protein [Pseudomonas putida]
MLETLSNMKGDLDRTAAHFEQLSLAMRGYINFSTARAAPEEVADLHQSLHGVQRSLESLRTVAARIIPRVGPPVTPPAYSSLPDTAAAD